MLAGKYSGRRGTAMAKVQTLGTNRTSSNGNYIFHFVAHKIIARIEVQTLGTNRMSKYSQFRLPANIGQITVCENS